MLTRRVEIHTVVMCGVAVMAMLYVVPCVNA